MSGPERYTLDLARRLVAFDTSSGRPNRPLIDFVAGLLGDAGADVEVIPDAGDEGKANLIATLGPRDAPGIVISGHTDVVPADPASWTTPPFEPDVRAGRLYGRGSADMKSFVAVALAVLPRLSPADWSNRAVIALSFDEEIGCVGAPRMMPRLRELLPGIRGCIIGEPTSMQVAFAHKGKIGVRVIVEGVEAHSGYPEQGINAIDIAAELVAYVRRLGVAARVDGPFDERFTPPYTSVQTGLVSGGSALNTVPARCSFEFEVRPLPGLEPRQYVEAVEDFFAHHLPSDLADADARIEIEPTLSYPGLLEENRAFIDWVAGLADWPGEPATLGFGSEAGLFAQLGVPAVVCGPGNIGQAHRPDEYIELEQLARSEAFFHRLGDALRNPLPTFAAETPRV